MDAYKCDTCKGLFEGYPVKDITVEMDGEKWTLVLNPLPATISGGWHPCPDLCQHCFTMKLCAITKEAIEREGIINLAQWLAEMTKGEIAIHGHFSSSLKR